MIQRDAAGDTPLLANAVVATDPTLLRQYRLCRSLRLLLRLAAPRASECLARSVPSHTGRPKDEELVATPYRHGGKDEAERFFMEGMGEAVRNMHRSGADGFPATLYYAFRQTEVRERGAYVARLVHIPAGRLVDAGYMIDGTWPMRTELAGNLKKRFNALASSIVLVCRKRPVDAPVLTRREFVAQLRSDAS